LLPPPNSQARQISQQFSRISNNLASIRRTFHVKSPDRMRLQSLLNATSSLLADASADVKSMVSKKDDGFDPIQARQRRIEHHKLSKDLSSLRTEFQELQTAAKETMRRSGWYLSSSSSVGTPLASATSSALEELMIGQYVVSQRQQQQQQSSVFEEELRTNEAHISEREEEVKKIEDGVQEVNAIFSNLSHIVVGQQAAVDNVQANVDGVLINAKKASEEISKAAVHQNKWGWLGSFF